MQKLPSPEPLFSCYATINVTVCGYLFISKRNEVTFGGFSWKQINFFAQVFLDLY